MDGSNILLKWYYSKSDGEISDKLKGYTQKELTKKRSMNMIYKREHCPT